ncbi:amidase [Methanocella sp. CWC-04]|uniref:Amidase n=1 Tax=Methanooceanicella nereidis TaxID=2052831 RepID=A0AAP2RDG7_9EURY|nr:amidase [Methanocella sp. CWC-04]MCD1295579.1 amidase [Methanocella sp. CWC-04]
MTDIVFRTAADLSKAILSGELSAVEVLEAHLGHIREYDPYINAIVTLDAENALRRAKEADKALARGEVWGPLHGVPMTIKDSFETAGLRTTSSNPALADHIPKKDATVVARLKAAGAVIMGKTNLPEMASGCHCDSPLFGRTNNPRDLSRTPGGSSGGSAAAVASCMTPLDIGSDISGSIRVPAHFCGVFGMKPTDHLVSFAGHVPGTPRGLLRYLISVGPLARSVEDLELALTLIAGPDGRQWEVPPVTLSLPLKKELKGLRLAWTDELGGVPVTEETRSSMERLAGELARQGCQVEKLNPPGFDLAEAIRTRTEIESTAMHTGSTPLHLPRAFLRWLSGLNIRDDAFISGYLKGAGSTLGTYSKALSRRDRHIKIMETFLAGRDAWLCPVASVPAPPHPGIRNHFEEMLASIDVDGKKIPYDLGTFAYTNPFNLSGNPVVVLPMSSTSDGLPLGVQIVGRRWMDMDILSVAKEIAKITGDFLPPKNIIKF